MIGMWPRALELALGLWLTVAPAVIDHGDDPAAAVARGAGAIFVVVVVLSMIPRIRRIHFATLPLALALVAWTWAGLPRPGPPGAQNLILVGLTLALLALVPTGATDPPEEWRPYVRDGVRERTGDD